MYTSDLYNTWKNEQFILSQLRYATFLMQCL